MKTCIFKKTGLYLRLLALFFAIMIGGCGRASKAPPPPTTRANLVLELFDSLESKDHALSLKKIEKLRTLDSSNIFLASLEISERNNKLIREIQQMLDSGNLKAAISEAEKYLAKYGMDDRIGAAKGDLETVAKIKSVIEAFEDSNSDSVKIARNAGELKEYSRKYPPATIFASLADDQLARARELREWENRRTLEDMESDYMVLSRENPRLAAVVFASLARQKRDRSSKTDYEQEIIIKDGK